MVRHREADPVSQKLCREQVSRQDMPLRADEERGYCGRVAAGVNNRACTFGQVVFKNCTACCLFGRCKLLTL